MTVYIQNLIDQSVRDLETAPAGRLAAVFVIVALN